MNVRASFSPQYGPSTENPAPSARHKGVGAKLRNSKLACEQLSGIPSARGRLDDGSRMHWAHRHAATATGLSTLGNGEQEALGNLDVKRHIEVAK